MGDSGVYFIGALISLVFLKNYNNQNLNLEEIILLSLVPILDMFRVIIFRLIRGLHPFTKDNLHLHYMLKQKYKNQYLWHIGSYLTIFNIFLLQSGIEGYLAISIGIIFYLTFTSYLYLSQKK